MKNQNLLNGFVVDFRLFLVLGSLCWAYYVIVVEYDNGVLYNLLL